MGLFMKPMFGLNSGNLTYEFTKSRGTIHYHSTNYCDSDLQKDI